MESSSRHQAASSSSSSSLSRGQRTSSNWHLDPENRISPDFNTLGQPIGDDSIPLSTAYGIVARMGNFCPITIDSWHDVPKTTKEEIFKYIKEHFNIAEKHKTYVLKSVNQSWKNHKIELRRLIDGYVEEGKSYQTISNDIPPEVEDLQWRQFVYTYLVEKRAEWEKRTKKARHSRAQLQEHHTCGRKSLARWKEEYGHEGAVELYKITHTKKKDRTISEYSSRVVNTCKALVEERISQGENVDRLALEEEVLREVRGPEHPGRVRGEGRGPTPSSMGIQNIRNERFEKQNAEMQRQRAEIEELKKREAARDAEFNDMKEQMRLLIMFLQGAGNQGQR